MNMITFNILASVVAFVLISGLYLTFSPKHRSTIFENLHLGRNKTNGSYTPPRSVSLYEKVDRQYADVFPPHRRHALADLPPDAMKGPGPTAAELSRVPPDYTKLIPYKDFCDSDDTTPTGFKVAEIERLGDFPDYAALSGVPLPKAYDKFNIDTALPRPYRPYRWGYHQTMCKYCWSLTISTSSTSDGLQLFRSSIRTSG
jgi:hypothetical protein